MFNFNKLHYLLCAVVFFVSLPLHAATDEHPTIWNSDIGGLSFLELEAKDLHSLFYQLHKNGFHIDNSARDYGSLWYGKYYGVNSDIYIFSDTDKDKIMQISVFVADHKDSRSVINVYNKFCKALNKEVAKGFLNPLKSQEGCSLIKADTNLYKLDNQELKKFTAVYGQSLSIKDRSEVIRILDEHWHKTKPNSSSSVKSLIAYFAMDSFERNNQSRYTVTLEIDRLTKMTELIVYVKYKDNSYNL